MSIHDIIIIAIGVIVGFLLAVIIYLIKRNSTFRIISQAKQIVEELKSNARNEIETSKKAAVLEAKDEWFKQKRVMEDEIKERQKELRRSNPPTAPPVLARPPARPRQSPPPSDTPAHRSSRTPAAHTQDTHPASDPHPCLPG